MARGARNFVSPQRRRVPAHFCFTAAARGARNFAFPQRRRVSANFCFTTAARGARNFVSPQRRRIPAHFCFTAAARALVRFFTTAVRCSPFTSGGIGALIFLSPALRALSLAYSWSYLQVFRSQHGRWKVCFFWFKSTHAPKHTLIS